MPTIKVPESVKIVDGLGQIVTTQEGASVSVDFVRSFLLGVVVNDPKFGKDLQSLHVSMDICEAFENKNAGDEVVISQEAWTKLKEVIREPSSPYNVSVMRQCKSFFTAILEPVKQ